MNASTPLLRRTASRLMAGLLLLGTALSGRAEETGLTARWLFSPDRQLNGELKAVTGGAAARLSGSPRFVKDPGPPRVELTGRNEELVVAEKLDPAFLPQRDLTLTAWVRVDRPAEWGAFIGAVQDNGDFERGWLLGYRKDRFCIALASEGGGRLTYLTANNPFETNRWYHVAGTYDGTTLNLFVDGQPAGSSTAQHGKILYPDRGTVVLGAYRDDDEHYRLVGALHEVRVYRTALDADSLGTAVAASRALFPAPAPPPVLFRPAYGPFVDWKDRRTAEVTWDTDETMPTGLELEAPDGSKVRLGDGIARRQHRVELTDLKRDLEYHYRLSGPDGAVPPVISPRYQFDTSFYYEPAAVPASAGSGTPAAAAAAAILDGSGVRDGYALVVGATDGALALELVRQSGLEVVVVESDPAKVRAVRQRLADAGVYGVRASVHQVSGTRLPHGDFLANLIVSESVLATGAPPALPSAEVHRLLRPSGGTLWFTSGTPADSAAWNRWLSGSELAAETTPVVSPSLRLAWRRGRLPGSGEWTHQYGNADNSACSQDELVRGELQVAWWGDPGPRPMPDRGNRNPAPLSVNGRLFVQGNRVLFGLDAYNGTILWSLSAPAVRRANVTRDSSNMAAFGDHLYVAQGRWCLALDGQTGARTRRYEVVENTPADAHDWGYLAAGDGWLVGSRVKSGSIYLGDDGEWYENFTPDDVSRICSDRLFSLDTATGATRWTYSGARILNSTITIGDGMIFFLESRSPAALGHPGSRIPIELLTDQELVCLDLRTGKRLWNRPHDFSSLQFMSYLVFGGNTVVVTGTDKDKRYHTFAFNAPSIQPAPGSGDDVEGAVGGRLLWSDVHKEDKGHHSGHLQHPLVIGDAFYSDQRSFDLRTGKLLRKDLPERRGCGVMSAGKNAVFFRHYFHGMWDLESDRRVQFEGIRSGCWLGLIPAGGFLLAPESSAGCSCTHAIQTSVGYIPKHLAAAPAP